MTLVPSTKPTSKSASTTLSTNKRPSHKHQLSEVLARRGEEGWLEDATFEDEHTEQDGDDEEERERSRGMTVDLGRLVEHAGEMRVPRKGTSDYVFLPPLKTALLLPDFPSAPTHAGQGESKTSCGGEWEWVEHSALEDEGRSRRKYADVVKA